MMKINTELLEKIHNHGESSYPEEGAGLLLGRVSGDEKAVTDILTVENAREDAARHNRYLLTPQDYLRGEQEAAQRGLDVLGVFHSHPDHPDQPSEFDREWAMPWFSYLITRVDGGKAITSRSWRLAEDRSSFLEEPIQITSIQ
jgi:proteasome lid subunit RPN8/RPN11